MNKAEVVFSKVAGWDRYVELLKGSKEKIKALEEASIPFKAKYEKDVKNAKSLKDFKDIIHNKDYKSIDDLAKEKFKVLGARVGTGAAVVGAGVAGIKILKGVNNE